MISLVAIVQSTVADFAKVWGRAVQKPQSAYIVLENNLLYSGWVKDSPTLELSLSLLNHCHGGQGHGRGLVP